jgi:hypothetical protein
MTGVLASGPELAGLGAIVILLVGGLLVTVALGLIGVAAIWVLHRMFP